MWLTGWCCWWSGTNWLFWRVPTWYPTATEMPSWVVGRKLLPLASTKDRYRIQHCHPVRRIWYRKGRETKTPKYPRCLAADYFFPFSVSYPMAPLCTCFIRAMTPFACSHPTFMSKVWREDGGGRIANLRAGAESSFCRTTLPFLPSSPIAWPNRWWPVTATITLWTKSIKQIWMNKWSIEQN